MNPLKMLTGLSKRDLDNITTLWNMAKENETLRGVVERLDGCNANEAYATLKELSDYELKVMAALIAQINIKFDRMEEGESA
jgi:hypothetical protein